MKWWIILLPILVCSCQGLEKSETERIRKANAIKEPIYRLSHEQFVSYQAPKKQLRERYPWEKRIVGNFPQITKDFFRCKGSYAHPAIETKNGRLHDCGGIEDHSLPIQEDKEFVYPALIDILNYVQGSLRARVVVTCGHRCPQHNQYADREGSTPRSKHMMGAEVDFYVEGYQERPYEVIKEIMQYYRYHETFKTQLPFTHFSQSQSLKYKHPIWMNRELIIRVFDPDEARDFDNRHSFTYITLELRYDRDTNRQLTYNMLMAHQKLLKH